jgi:uncharacterized iron-regulated membrane protein
MTRTPTARLRRLWLDVHLWIGVGLLVAIVPLSVSGAALVWHDALDRALYQERYAVSAPDVRLPVSAYAMAAEEVFGDSAVLTQLRLPQTAGDPVVAVGRLNGEAGPGGRPRTLNVWIDPPTGKVLASGEVAKSFTMVLHRLHGTLMIPQVGRKVVGWLGWAMLISSATGLWLWWPRNGAVLKALRWRRGASELFNLHHMVGFWVCLPLAVLSLTGVYISFPQTSRALFGVAQPQQAGGPRRFAPPLAEPRTSLADAVAAAQAARPGASVVSVQTPTQGQAPAWRIQLKAPDAGQASTVQVLDATGEAKAGRGGSERGGAGDTLSPLMRKIHDGAGTGIVWQSIIFLAGLAPAVLAFTGLMMWLRRRARQTVLRPQPAE